MCPSTRDRGESLCLCFYCSLINLILHLQVKDEDEDAEMAKKDEKVKQLFLKLAGEDGEVDWMELKEIMDFTMRNGKLAWLYVYCCAFELFDPSQLFLYYTCTIVKALRHVCG